MTIGGSIAGLGGAALTIGNAGAFGREMSGGFGFIALAVVILGRWNPIYASLAALLFGFSIIMRVWANQVSPGIPTDFITMVPYVVTIIAVVGFVVNPGSEGTRSDIREGLVYENRLGEPHPTSIDVLPKSYSPYSKFPVGAAAICDDGRIITGVNVENASYGLALCAECSLVSELFRTGGGQLVAFACVDGQGNPLMPCGRCRQLLYEHSAEGMLLQTVSGIKTINEVLPMPLDRRILTAMSFSAVELIIKKREQVRLVPRNHWLVENYTSGVVADEQMSAMAMAILLNGMSRDEIKDLTMAMIASGERLNFSGLTQPTADKHSTGGVGDKITLPLAPLVASYGIAVPQLSGRGLGHTGGTLITSRQFAVGRPVFRTQSCIAASRSWGSHLRCWARACSCRSQTIFLRDVTGTVEAIPLIASSIMSKKIAEGPRHWFWM